jgi:hypothetical protein
MGKININEPIDVDNNTLVPVKPALDSYRIPFVTDPNNFMMYGENSLQKYNVEVKRMEEEIRRELFANEPQTEEVEMKSRTNISSVFSIIFGLLLMGMLVIGKFLKIDALPNLFVIAGNMDGLSYLIKVFNGINSGMDVAIMPLVISVCTLVIAVISIITIIMGFATVKRQNTMHFMYILFFISFIAVDVIAVMLLVNNNTINIGLYILLGITFISFFVGICSKIKDRKNNIG